MIGFVPIPQPDVDVDIEAFTLPLVGERPRPDRIEAALRRCGARLTPDALVWIVDGGDSRYRWKGWLVGDDLAITAADALAAAGDWLAAHQLRRAVEDSRCR